MKVNRAEFVSRLEKVYPAVGKNRVVPGTQYLQISRGTIWATNGAMVIRTQFPADLDFECGVLGKPLLQLLRSVDCENIELIREGRGIHVNAGKVNAVFADYPMNYTAGVVTPDCTCNEADTISGLVKGLDACKFAVSKFATEKALCGVLLDEDILQSTDRQRIVLWSLHTSLTGMRCSIPVMLIDVMNRVKDEISMVGYSASTGRFVVVLHDGTYIDCLTYNGQFRDLRNFLPASGSPSVKVSCADQVAGAIERHIAFLADVESHDKRISFRLYKDKCTVASQYTNIEYLEEELKVSCDADSEVGFDVNPLYLRDVAGLCSDFTYFTTAGILLIESGELRYLVCADSRDITASDCREHRIGRDPAHKERFFLANGATCSSTSSG